MDLVSVPARVEREQVAITTTCDCLGVLSMRKTVLHIFTRSFPAIDGNHGAVFCRAKPWRNMNSCHCIVAVLLPGVTVSEQTDDGGGGLDTGHHHFT